MRRGIGPMLFCVVIADGCAGPGCRDDAPTAANRERDRVGGRARGATSSRRDASVVTSTRGRGSRVKTGFGGRKRALLIGIADYHRPGMTDSWVSLDGTENDVETMAEVLEEKGFEVSRLVDEEATHDGILQAIRTELVDSTTKEDIVVFYFSGHGQQIRDDVDRDETDGYDESIVPYDHSGIGDPSRNVRDDDLAPLFSRLTSGTKHFVAIFDSCHSGTASRGVRRAKGRGPVSPPATTPLPADAVDEDEALGALVVLAAARSDEQAYEWKDLAGGEVYGAFTYGLADALRSASPSATYADVMRQVAARMPSMGTSQRPMLSGDGDRRVLSGEFQPRVQSLAVEPISRTSATRVRGGTLDGLRIGAELALFAPGAGREALEAELAGAPRVVVKRASAIGAWIFPSPERRAALSAEFSAGARALLVGVPPDEALRVMSEVHAGSLGTWFDGAEGADRDPDPLVEIVPWSAESTEYDLAFRVEGRPSGGGEADQQVVTAIDATGAAVGMPIGPADPVVHAIPLEHENLAGVLAQTVRAESRRRRILGLEAIGPNEALDVHLAVELMAAEYDGFDSCVPTERLEREVARGPVTTIPLGRCFRFRVRNEDQRPVFVHVLALDPNGRVSVVFPRALERENRIPPGREIAVGEAYASEPRGESTMKLIAAVEPIDNLEGLEFDPEDLTGGAPTKGHRPSHSLARVLADLASRMRGTGTVGISRIRWGTAEAVIEVVAPERPR